VAQEAKNGVTERRVFELSDRVLAVAPVVSLEGPKGTLALELSKAALESGRTAVQRTSLIMGSTALVVGVLLALVIAHSFARRLRAIASVAGLVAAGDLTQSAPSDGSHDEIGSLSRSFGIMLEQLKRLIAEIKTRAEQEQARLEGLVEQRTQALVRRNADMRRVLDNVDQGFLTIDRAGKMSEERSAIIGRWLGTAPASGVLWDYIEQAAPGMGLPLSLGWEQVREDILPLEVSVQMMPRSFVVGTNHYAIDYKPTLTDSGALEGMLVVLSDVTVVVERQRLEDEEREVLQLFSRVLQDRAGVLEFLAETHRLVETITRGTPEEVAVTKRLLHTLKGNTGLYGLQSIAKLCHDLEDNMQEEGGNLSRADADRLHAFWQAISTKLGGFIDAPKSGGVTIDDSEYGELLAAVAAGVPHAQLAGMVGAWQLEPVELRLRRLAQQAQGLAERLQKLPLDVRVEAGRLRIDSTRLLDVWGTLPHLVRNAVDHGIETPEQRLAAGKKERASLVLRAALNAQQFSIEIEDSGRGIDWDALRAVAAKKGVPCSNQRELSDALFADGVSTRSEVTENSGRGVGTAALARAVKATGGRIEVFSERGKGTRFRLTWPAAVARPSLVKAIPGGLGPSGGRNGMGLRS
jgi:two-component system chemotaxis sensor kinase CheA